MHCWTLLLANHTSVRWSTATERRICVHSSKSSTASEISLYFWELLPGLTNFSFELGAWTAFSRFRSGFGQIGRKGGIEAESSFVDRYLFNGKPFLALLHRVLSKKSFLCTPHYHPIIQVNVCFQHEVKGPFVPFAPLSQGWWWSLLELSLFQALLL